MFCDSRSSFLVSAVEAEQRLGSLICALAATEVLGSCTETALVSGGKDGDSVPWLGGAPAPEVREQDMDLWLEEERGPMVEICWIIGSRGVRWLFGYLPSGAPGSGERGRGRGV